jgi:hypothetical protein
MSRFIRALGAEFAVNQCRLAQRGQLHGVAGVEAPVRRDMPAHGGAVGEVGAVLCALLSGVAVAFGEQVCQQAREQVLLAGEVVVERPRGAAGFGGDVGDLGVQIALPGEYAPGGIFERGLGAGRLFHAFHIPPP